MRSPGTVVRLLPVVTKVNRVPSDFDMLTPQQLNDLAAQVRLGARRHWRLSAIALVTVLMLTLVGTLMMPRSYISEARIYVRFGRENLVLDPTASNGQLISINESRESELNSLLEVLKSRSLFDKLVEELGPQYILTGRGEPNSSKQPSSKGQKSEPTRQRLAPPIADQPSIAHQRAVQQLERTLEIWVPRKSNIITLRCKARTPEVAQQILAKLIEVYLVEHVRVHHTPGSYEFFEEQTRLSKSEWIKAADKLQESKDRLGIITIEGKKKLLQDEIADIESKLLTNQAELKTSEAKIASLQELIGGLPESIITTQSQAPNAAFDNMRGTLFQLETREQELAARMKDDHPLLLAVRQQLNDLRSTLAEQPSQRMQATEAVNPSRQALELSLLNEQSQADALRGRAASLAKLAEKLQQDLRHLNSYEVSLAQMQQEVDLSEARNRTYADKLEQARINRSLDEERISSLTLVQPATYALKPTGPRRAYVLALGLAVALLTAAGVVFAAMYLNPVLATGRDIGRLLELPLVGLVPRQGVTGAAL